MFSHLDKRQMPQMVDISAKVPCYRTARAEASITLHPRIVAQLERRPGAALSGPEQDTAQQYTPELYSPKGAVFHTAILAGIQAAKQTPQLIPLCHPIPLSACDIGITMQGETVCIECRVASHYATGVEMEAITGAAVAAITIYDMCKGIHAEMTIGQIRLLEKTKR